MTAKRVIVACGIVVFVLAVGAFAYQKARVHLASSVLSKIDQLSLFPPRDVPEMEWAILVYWTHNLHCASILQSSVPYSELRRLDHDLSEILASKPSRKSIDELWDRYSSLTDGGARYRAKFEAVRDSIIDAAAKEGDAFFDRESYREFVASPATPD